MSYPAEAAGAASLNAQPPVYPSSSPETQSFLVSASPSDAPFSSSFAVDGFGGLAVGPCAAGGGHEIVDEFTACGLVCGIVLFPVGLICCLTMKDRTCMQCGMKFD